MAEGHKSQVTKCLKCSELLVEQCMGCVCFWFLLMTELKGAKASSVKPECFRFFAAQVLEGSPPIFCCLPVPYCGFTRRI